MPALSLVAVQDFFINGVPALGGKLFIYAAATTTKITTYTDSTGSTAQTNPIVLNARGEPQNSFGASVGIWIPTGIAYKLVFTSPTDTDPPTTPIWTVDNLLSGSCVFSARMSADQTNQTGDGTVQTVIFDTALTNSGAYNPANGIFTAPLAGNYNFEAIVTATSMTGHATAVLQIATTQNTIVRSSGIANLDGAGNAALQVAALLPMAVGDVARVQLAVSGGSGSKNVGIYHGAGDGVWSSLFSGTLVS
jgi:hypothetical protein